MEQRGGVAKIASVLQWQALVRVCSAGETGRHGRMLAMTTAAPDRRTTLRVPLAIAVLCEPGRGIPFAGVMSDLSLGGARIESFQAPAVGSVLTITVRLPGAPDLSRLPALVRWSKSREFGVQFGHLDAGECRRIAELMAEAFRS